MRAHRVRRNDDSRSPRGNGPSVGGALMRRRLALLGLTLGAGSLGAWLVHAWTDSAYAVLVAPATLALAWLFVGTPQDCTPDARGDAPADARRDAG